MASSASAKVYLTNDCLTPHYRPHKVVVACGDGNFYFDHIHWNDDWNSKVAHGHGTAHANDCIPDCADGHFHKYPVKLKASKVRECKGKTQYLNLRWTYPDSRPPGAAKTDRTSFDWTC